MPSKKIDYELATRMLNDEGLTVAEVADYFDVTVTAVYMGIRRGTIDYKVPTPKRMNIKRAEKLLTKHSAREVSVKLGVERQTVYKAIRAGKLERPAHVTSRSASVRRIDLEAAQRLLDAGFSVPTVARMLDVSRQAVYYALEDGRLHRPVAA